jgi:diguanylate cyclase (GGDEF)-like protein
VQEKRFVFEGESIPVTVSLGAAELNAGQDATAFVKAADEKLYEAKRSGRNRVCI